MPSDVDALRSTPIFAEVDRWARRTAPRGRSMLTFSAAGTPSPGASRTVLELLAAAREDRTPRHALRRG